MDYVTLDFEPGMQANGTLYKNRNVWWNGDRVRWHNNAIRPIGGWSRFPYSLGLLDQVLTDPTGQKARALRAWNKNDGSEVYVVGHNEGLKAWGLATGTVHDITPAAFTPRDPGPSVSTGYGMWYYGRWPYGTERPAVGADLRVFNWCLRNWGENLLAAERVNPTQLYEWDAVLTNIAVPVSGAPTDFDCFHVTEQRIVMVAGSDTEPRLVQWSDSEDNTSWTPATDNQAGFQMLPGVGRFVEIVEVADQVLLISQTDAHVGRYIGPPYIFGFDRIADDCGCVAGAAVATTETFAMWPGERTFYMFDGSLRRVECPVMDRFKAALSSVNAGKITSFVNTIWGEVWWLYQSNDSPDGDVDSYIAFNWNDGTWITGTLDRTGGGGHPATFGPVLIGGSDGYAYQHEMIGVPPYDADPAEVYAETGPLQFTQNGRGTQYVGAIVPDLIEAGEVDLYLIGRDRPTAPETTYGPYLAAMPATGAQPIPTRARGHTLRLRLAGRDGTFVVGSMRLDAGGGGRK